MVEASYLVRIDSNIHVTGGNTMRNHKIVLMTLTLVALFLTTGTAASRACEAPVDTLWSETYEGTWTTNWHVDGGTWQIGHPNSGPGGAFREECCAATVLGGNYSEPVDSRLIRHTAFVVPPESQNPRLRFWHWYSFSTSDYAQVHIKVEGGSWQTLFSNYTATGSGCWTRPYISLAAYAGESVQIAFKFHSQIYGSTTDVSSGWYIDQVMVETGQVEFCNPENFESGLGNWSARRGTWQVGAPGAGPGGAHSGTKCAGTRLNGNYYEPVDSRLVSPPFVVPSAEQSPRLRFWHWYSFSTSDYGEVQIKVAGGSWQNIFSNYTATGSNCWTRPAIGLAAYAGQQVQIAFDFHSQIYGSTTDVSSGWYIDDVEIVTGPEVFNEPEDFEGGMGDWFSRRGTWQIGKPTSGPGSARSGSNCAVTRLNGSYYEPVDSRLVSPLIEVPSADQLPRLRFWHWYSFSTSDLGEVHIKKKGGSWEVLYSNYTATGSGVWTCPSLDLTAYADTTVRIAFDFHSQIYGSTTDVSSGWYIDDVEIVTGPYDIPEGFDTGLGDWSAQRGTWQVGTPSSGPGSAYSPPYCAATILKGNYAEPVHSRLISPPFLVDPASSTHALTFWHWFNFSTSDYGQVQIREVGGSWQNFPDVSAWTGPGTIWSYYYVPLHDYIGATVQIGFLFHSQIYGSTTDVSSGWYIDDVMANGLVMTLLADYTAQPLPTGEVDLSWGISSDTEALEFKLLAQCGAENWDVPVENPGPFQYSALDVRPRQLGGGEILYTLFFRTGDEDWRQLSEQQVEVTLPANTTRLLGASPNPFNPQTTVRFELDRPQEVRLVIYDVSGRRVKVLADGPFATGQQAVPWLGRDEDGRAVASGIYFARLSTRDLEMTSKLMLVR